MNLEEILHWTVIVCVAYLALVYASYFALAFAGLVENSTRRRESAAEDYETIAGLLIEKFRRIPEKGETLALSGLSIEVIAANDRAVEVVRITKRKK